MIECEKLPDLASCQDGNCSVLYTEQKSHPLIKFIVFFHLPGNPVTKHAKVYVSETILDHALKLLFLPYTIKIANIY